MKRVAFDTETFLLNTRGKATTKTVPRLVCASFAEEGEDPELWERERAVPRLKALFERDDCKIIGHNVAFDLLVSLRAIQEDLDEDMLPRVFELFDEGRIQDTLVREKLYDIARGGTYRRGGYGLKDLVKRRLGEKVKGKSGADAWRMRYNELDGVPVEEYPPAASEYALLDAVYTLRVAQDQGEYIPNEDFQAAADFCLSLMSAWGMRVDTEWARAVDGWYAKVEQFNLDHLVRWGIAYKSGKIPRDRKQDLVRNAFREIGESPKLTKTGQVSTAKDVLEYLEEQGYEDKHGIFPALLDYQRARKFRSTYLEPLLDAGEAGEPLCPRFNVLVDSGRTSSSKPNIQNVVSRITPKERRAIQWFNLSVGEKLSALERLRHPEGFAVGPDIRGCIVPREGKAFVGADYSAIEMAGAAQVIRNWTGELTALGKSINAGEDQHLRVTAEMRNLPYAEVKRLYDDFNEAMEEGREPLDPVIDWDRFLSKSGNYGFLGGASAETWMEYTKGMGASVDLRTAERTRAAWFRAWPEMDDIFFPMIQDMRMPGGDYLVEQHGPDRMTSGWRRRVTDRFTSAANSTFQGIVSGGCKHAAWLLQKACYIDSTSPLYGARPVIFEHDAFYVEVDAEQAEEAAPALEEVMVDGMSLFIPDIEVEAEAEIMTERWGK